MTNFIDIAGKIPAPYNDYRRSFHHVEQEDVIHQENGYKPC